MKDDRLYLIDMLETARRIERRMTKLNQAEFDSSEDIQLALTHLLQMIGEAARRVSESFRRSTPLVDWTSITGMRHQIVHDYMQVNFGVVWQTCVEDIPLLIATLAPIVDPIIAESRKREPPKP